MPMTDGMDLSLQKALVEVLTSDSNLGEVLGVPPKIFQNIIADTVDMPYIQIGETQEIDDSVQCLDASEIFVDIHIWVAEPNFVLVKRLANLVRKLIHLQDIVLDEERCVLIEHRVTRTFMDADPTIKHAIVTFRALTEITS